MSETVDVTYAEGETFTRPYLHITGDDNTVCGDHCVIRGDHNQVDGNFCTIYGTKNTVSGEHCAVIGHDNLVPGSQNHVTGNYNFITGNECHSVGIANTLTGMNCTAEGDGNTLGRPASVQSNDYSQLIAATGHFASSVAVTAETTSTRTEPRIPCPSEADALNDVKAEPDASNVCIICQENVPQAAAIPCMHLSYCLGCARTMCCVRSSSSYKVNCAKCRKPAIAVTRVYLES